MCKSYIGLHDSREMDHSGQKLNFLKRRGQSSSPYFCGGLSGKETNDCWTCWLIDWRYESEGQTCSPGEFQQLLKDLLQSNTVLVQVLLPQGQVQFKGGRYLLQATAELISPNQWQYCVQEWSGLTVNWSSSAGPLSSLMAWRPTLDGLVRLCWTTATPSYQDGS